MRTSNPALNEGTIRKIQVETGQDRMTVGGTINKVALSLLILLVGATFTWNRFYSTNDPASVSILMWVGSLGGLGVALLTFWKQEWSPITAPLYAALKGLALGAISAFFEVRYPGIVIQAVVITFTVMAALLVVYKSGMIRVTQKFRLGVFAATGGIFLFYIVAFIGSFFGLRIAFLHEGSMFGILFSLFVVIVAAMNLVLDFDFIDRAAQRGAPKYFEWYGAFGLMVTLVWLYIEILRLLAKMRDRR